MKKILSFIMAAMMVVMMLPAVVGAAVVVVDKPTIINTPYYISNRNERVGLAINFPEQRSFAIGDIEIEIYSDDTLLAVVSNEKALNTQVIKTNPRQYRITANLQVGDDDPSSWEQTNYTFFDYLVPNKFVLYVDGQKYDEMDYELDAETWISFGGTFESKKAVCEATDGHDFTEWERDGYKNVRECEYCGKPEVKALTSAQIAADQVKNYVKSRSTVPYAVAIDADETVVITNNTSKNRTIKDLGDSALYGFMTDVKYSFAAVEGYEIVSVTVDGVEVKDPANVKIFQIKKNSVIKVVTAAVEAEEAAE